MDNKTLKSKTFGEEMTLNVTKNVQAQRIFVEFKSVDGKLTLQRNFPDTFAGRGDADSFAKKFKALKDLRKYFGLEK